MAECVYEDLLPLPLMVCIMGWHITGKKTKEELLSNLKLGKVEYVIFTSGNDPLAFRQVSVSFRLKYGLCRLLYPW